MENMFFKLYTAKTGLFLDQFVICWGCIIVKRTKKLHKMKTKSGMKAVEEPVRSLYVLKGLNLFSNHSYFYS